MSAMAPDGIVVIPNAQHQVGKMPGCSTKLRVMLNIGKEYEVQEEWGPVCGMKYTL